MVRCVHLLVIALTVITVLGQFGVETTSFIALLGASGIAIGLALLRHTQQCGVRHHAASATAF